MLFFAKKVTGNQSHSFNQRFHPPHKIKNLSAVSRILSWAIIYLAATLLLQSCCLPFSAPDNKLPGSNEPLSNADIRGITAHKVYPFSTLLQKTVSSYLTFSPLPQWLVRAVIFCGTCCLAPFARFDKLSMTKNAIPAVSRCVALCCPDFPPPGIIREAIAWLIDVQM